MTSTIIKYTALLIAGMMLAWAPKAQSQSTEGLTPLDVANIEQVDEIAIAPSGKKAIYTLRVQANPQKENKPASYHLYLIDLPSGNSLPYDTTMSVSDIDFRPQHNTITFLGSRDSDETTALYEMPMGGGEAQKLLSFPTDIAAYSWASDGNHLAFMAADTVEQEESPLPYQPEVYEENLKQRRGYVTNVAKENHPPHQLQIEGSIYQMHWNPDGKRLAVAVAPTPLVDDYYMHQQVYITGHHGKKIQSKVEHKGKLGDISWSPDGSKLAMIAGADIHDPIAGRLFVVSAEGGKPRQLQPQLKQKFEQFQWVNNNTLHYLTSKGVWSRVLVYPVDYEKGKKYPMITSVHGGPESHYNDGWVTGYSDAGQVGAAQGYFVFYPNYRGSTGRGETFAKSSQADMAGAEFDDIVAGVDELIDVGIVDSAKVGVTGGSYGGYATGWMSTRYTDRFAAGVMFVGISNNISKWGTSDIPEELFLVHARERIWEDYQSFLERSPIYYAGQAKTPLLIMAGKEDTRVGPGQSYELYRHIKTRTETPVRLVLYPGEGHGNTKATARLDYNLRMMRWFNEYLKGEAQERPDDELKLENTTIEN